MLCVARPFEFFQNRALIDLVRMQFERQRAESNLPQAAVDDVQGRHLLGDEQDLLPSRHGGGDDVGDGLRLARAGRPFDHEGPSAGGLRDDHRLGTVGVDDVMEFERLNDVVDGVVLADEGSALREAVAQKGADHLAGVDAGFGGPVVGVQVPIH